MLDLDTDAASPAAGPKELRPFVADVADADAVERTIEHVMAKFGASRPSPVRQQKHHQHPGRRPGVSQDAARRELSNRCLR